MNKEQTMIKLAQEARQLLAGDCQSMAVDIKEFLAIIELAEERQADNSRLREERAILSREANGFEERLNSMEKDDYFASLVAMARVAADRAMKKFPQPNYVLTKVSEEHGEVIKAVVHYLEGRETWENVEGELVDNLAMLIRLVVEGDQVIGFTPPESVLNYQPASPAAATELKPLEWTEERQPDEDIRYNHVIADSVLGRFSVEWKGWKDYDSRDLYLAGEYIDSFHSVDEAKAGAAAHLLKIYNSLAGKGAK